MDATFDEEFGAVTPEPPRWPDVRLPQCLTKDSDATATTRARLDGG